MKKASVLLMVLAVLFVIGEGCAESADNTTPPHENFVSDDANQPDPVSQKAAPSAAEVKCKDSAKKWVNKAEGLLDEVIESSTKHSGNPHGCAQTLIDLAKLQAAVGDMKSARENLDRALKRASKYRAEQDGQNALCMIAYAQADLGLDEAARDTATMIEKKRYYMHYTSIVRIQLRRKAFAEAKRTAKASDRVGQCYYEIAKAEYAMGRYEDAQKTLALVEKCDIYSDLFAPILRGQCAVKLGDKAAARKHFKAAVDSLAAKKPADPYEWRHGLIARAQAEVGMLDEAVATLEPEAKKCVYYVLVTLAELKYQQGKKKEAADLLAKLKKVVMEDERVHLRIMRLGSIARVQAGFRDKEAARETIKQAWEEYKRIEDKEKRYLHLEEAVRLLQREFEAGFRKEAEARIKEVFPDDPSQVRPYPGPKGSEGLTGRMDDHVRCTKDQALAGLAVLYAQAGEFAEAHRIIMSFDWSKKERMGYNWRGPYYTVIGQVGALAIEAGATKYIPDFIDQAEKVSDKERYKFIMLAQLLSRGGFDERLAKTYAAMKEQTVFWRYKYCITAAQGYFKRIDDIRANGTEAAQVSQSPSTAKAESMAEAKKWVKEAEKLAVTSGGKVVVNLDLAVLLARTGDREAAIKLFDQAIKNAPTQGYLGLSGENDPLGHALCDIAEAQAKAGLYEQARKTAMQAKTYRDRALGAIRNIAIEDEEWDIAKELCQNGDYYYVAVCQARAGMFEDAKKTAALMLKDNACRAVTALAEIALLEAQAGKLDEAKKTLASAEKNLPGNAATPMDYFFHLALRVEVELGMYKAAEARLANIKGAYNKIPALILVAETEFKSGDKKSAAKLLDEAKSIASKPPITSRLCEVAVAEAKVLGKGAAMKTFEQAWRIDRKREHSSEYGQIVKAIARAGLYAEAKTYAMKWRNGESSAMMSIAAIQAEAGLYEEAERTAAKAIDLGKNVKGFRITMDGFRGRTARIQADKGEFKQAYETLKSIDSPMQYDIVEVIKRNLDAGETQHMDGLLKILDECTRPRDNRTFYGRNVAWVLARVGDDKGLEARYKKIEGGSLVFCLGAAEGYLQRIKHIRAAGAKN